MRHLRPNPRGTEPESVLTKIPQVMHVQWTVTGRGRKDFWDTGNRWLLYLDAGFTTEFSL